MTTMEITDETRMELKSAWVKASKHKDWEVADIIEKVIHKFQAANSGSSVPNDPLATADSVSPSSIVP